MDFDRTLHNNWDRQLEDGLPDSRLTGPQRRRTQIQIGRLTYDRVFCADCGEPHGVATADALAFVFYLCNECYATKYANKPPPGMGVMTEEEEKAHGLR